jgi:hypothetical protein
MGGFILELILVTLALLVVLMLFTGVFVFLILGLGALVMWVVRLAVHGRRRYRHRRNIWTTWQ